MAENNGWISPAIARQRTHLVGYDRMIRNAGSSRDRDIGIRKTSFSSWTLPPRHAHFRPLRPIFVPRRLTIRELDLRAFQDCLYGGVLLGPFRRRGVKEIGIVE